MTDLTRVVDDRIWAMDRPVWFSGVRLRARTTIVRLDDGGLLVHSPAPTEAAIAQLRALGAVRWLVSPNAFHHLGMPAAAAAFPEAQVLSPATIRDARIPEVETLPLHGVPFLDETVLYHEPTQTLLGADMVLSAHAEDHWTWRWAARITGCYDRLRVPPDVRKKIRDKPAAAGSIRAMLDRPARRLVVAHANIVEDGWRDQLANAWRQEGVEV